MTIREIVDAAFKEALARNGGNRTHTAKELGISVRTVRNWIAGRRGKNAHVKTTYEKGFK